MPTAVGCVSSRVMPVIDGFFATTPLKDAAALLISMRIAGLLDQILPSA